MDGQTEPEKLTLSDGISMSLLFIHFSISSKLKAIINPFATSGSYMSHSKLFVNMKMSLFVVSWLVPIAICPFYGLSFHDLLWEH
jgi:uncharacterized membrane protein YcgQ (UPF0703/DUF1980 family)